MDVQQTADTDTTARTEARATRRVNHFSEALAALRGLVAAWPGDREDPAYRAARHYLKTTCRSCGALAYRNSLCRDCWARWGQEPPRIGGAA